jgi:hypothetical protein
MSAVAAVTASMTAMATVHEHVQQRACGEEYQRQPAQRVDPVLAEKEEQGNARKCQEDQHQARPQPAPILDCPVLHLLSPVLSSEAVPMMEQDASMARAAK